MSSSLSSARNSGASAPHSARVSAGSQERRTLEVLAGRCNARALASRISCLWKAAASATPTPARSSPRLEARERVRRLGSELMPSTEVTNAPTSHAAERFPAPVSKASGSRTRSSLAATPPKRAVEGASFGRRRGVGRGRWARHPAATPPGTLHVGFNHPTGGGLRRREISQRRWLGPWNVGAGNWLAGWACWYCTHVQNDGANVHLRGQPPSFLRAQPDCPAGTMPAPARWRCWRRARACTRPPPRLRPRRTPCCG